VYGSSDKFALAMFQRSAPTLLAYGGTFVNMKEMNIENILPIAFPFGIGGPKMNRKVKVSHEMCIQYYMRLSLPQFREGPTILVLNHILNRQLSYKTGVMLCRSSINGVPLGEKLSTLSMSDLEKINDNKNDHLNANTKSLMSAISTSCRAMGHTEEAAKYARRCCFALLDNFGLNSVFLTTTPDDECSFRVRLYSKPEIWVSQFVTSLNSCFENNAGNTQSYINVIYKYSNSRKLHFLKIMPLLLSWIHMNFYIFENCTAWFAFIEMYQRRVSC
jgi:hypothetical protein